MLTLSLVVQGLLFSEAKKSHMQRQCVCVVHIALMVVHITLRSENTNEVTCVVECTGDSISPRTRRPRVALPRSLQPALYLSAAFETPRVYVLMNKWVYKSKERVL